MQKKPDRTVRCAYCGREFIEPIPHRCSKNYRKRHLKWINIMKEEKERKQFNVQDFVSNEETPVETRDGRCVKILDIDVNHPSSLRVRGQIDGEQPNDRRWSPEGKYFEDRDHEYDLFFKNTKLESTPLNLAKLLKDAPKGTKLYSPIFGECEFDEVNEDRDDRIEIIYYSTGVYKRLWATFDKDGTYSSLGECLLFPSRDNHDWRTFKVEKGFEVGDHIVQNKTGRVYFLTRKEDGGFLMKRVNCPTSDYDSAGWVADENLKKDYKKVEKFNPEWLKHFDGVLVRESTKCEWFATSFSHLKDWANADVNHYYTGIGCCFRYCIPCNAETEHLIGTSDDEPEFYKTK